MKIKKSDLIQIIKEELSTKLKESYGAAWEDPDNSTIAEDAAQSWAQMQLKFFEEQPDAFEGRSDEDSWDNQVHNARADASKQITDILDRVEAQLHDGQFNY